jgi:pimeloyl-ACP methyl ester carboxylesterase
MNPKTTKSVLAMMVAAALLGGCFDDDNDDGDVVDVVDVTDPEPARVQDTREFAVNPDTLPFEPLDGTSTNTWWGVMDSGAGYLVEVPANWNGRLVMYAHGYRGEGEELTVSPPRIRQWLIDNGYAWAASSYSTNYYDVRTGIEDTNALALQFNEIAEENGRSLDQPSKIYITGHSMGGHVTAAAIEEETHNTANNVVRYDGAVPMCGVVADTLEFEYLQDFTFAAQHVAEMGPTDFPAEDFNAEAINAELWQTVPSFQQQGVPTDKGLILEGIVENLSGGDRPLFEEGFRGGYYNVVMGTGGRDGTVNGILAEDLSGNADTEYQFDTDPALSQAENNFNSTIFRVEGNPSANAMRADGLRWIPVVNGEFDGTPVVTIHGLGDLYVPFVHEQEYFRRAQANGSDDWLVQRAIRAPGHCDFTLEEQVTAFEDMVNWEINGIKPEGEVSVTDPDVISQADYGCQFSTTGEASDGQTLDHREGCPVLN